MPLKDTAEIVSLCVAAVATIVALPGWASRLGVVRRGWVYVYRDTGKALDARNAIWITCALRSASISAATACLLLLLDTARRPWAAGAWAIGMLFLVLAGALRGGPAPAWVKPRWLRQMEKADWCGYWGDQRDRESARALGRVWIASSAIIIAGLVTCMLLISRTAFTYGAVAYGGAALLGMLGTVRSRRRM